MFDHLLLSLSLSPYESSCRTLESRHGAIRHHYIALSAQSRFSFPLCNNSLFLLLQSDKSCRCFSQINLHSANRRNNPRNCKIMSAIVRFYAIVHRRYQDACLSYLTLANCSSHLFRQNAPFIWKTLDDFHSNARRPEPRFYLLFGCGQIA